MLSCNTKKNPQKLQLKSEGYNRFPTFPVVTKINALFCALFGLFIHQKIPGLSVNKIPGRKLQQNYISSPVLEPCNTEAGDLVVPQNYVIK